MTPQRKYFLKNREVIVEYKRMWRFQSFNRMMARKYGVKEETIAALRESPCEICGEKKRIVLDHDPATGKLRGALCNLCNTSLGKMGDNVEGVKRALKYLESKL